MTTIDQFVSVANSSSIGGRSALAIAALAQQWTVPDEAATGTGRNRPFPFLLLVKALGGHAEQFTKDPKIGHDSYTSMADASISFMVLDVASNTVIRSGICTGTTLIHGEVGKAPERDFG